MACLHGLRLSNPSREEQDRRGRKRGTKHEAITIDSAVIHKQQTRIAIGTDSGRHGRPLPNDVMTRSEARFVRV